MTLPRRGWRRYQAQLPQPKRDPSSILRKQIIHRLDYDRYLRRERIHRFIVSMAAGIWIVVIAMAIALIVGWL